MKSSRTWRCLQSARELGLATLGAWRHDQEGTTRGVHHTSRSNGKRTWLAPAFEVRTQEPATLTDQQTHHDNAQAMSITSSQAACCWLGVRLMAWPARNGASSATQGSASSWLHSHQPYLKVSSKRARSLQTPRQGSPASSKARQQTCMARPHAPSHHSDRPVSVRLRAHQQSTRQGTDKRHRACMLSTLFFACLGYPPGGRLSVKRHTGYALGARSSRVR